MKRVLIGLLVGLLVLGGTSLWASEDLQKRAEDITKVGIVGPREASMCIGREISR